MKKIVKWFAISLLAVIIITDIIFAIFGYTYSEYIRDLESFDNLWVLAYYGGIILGHWMINLWKKSNLWLTKYKTPRYITLFGMGILALILNLTILKYVAVYWYITVPSGLATGALLWPLAEKKKK